MLSGSMVRKIANDKLGIRFTDGQTVISCSAYSLADVWETENVSTLNPHA